ncbi:MAG: anaerobic sulfite reductase subunit AsrA [Lachnospirales bacterium]
MGYKLSTKEFNSVLDTLKEDYIIYAPKLLEHKGHFSDTDLVKYEKISKIEEVEFNIKSKFSFKEVLNPITETLFYYTEDNTTVPEGPKKGAIIFLRSCDLHAVKRLDEIYLENGFPDFYYDRIRQNVKFVLMGCENTFDNCFCVDMGSNTTSEYDFSVDFKDDYVYVNNKCVDFIDLFKGEEVEVTPSFVESNKVSVELPGEVDLSLFSSDIWEEYNKRCISCGRCNFVCPTCTCYTMQDIFYEDNGKVGERRRVWASCHVDGYTDMAGGHAFRNKKSERMRFKVLHKVYDFNKRFGYHMCVGCGRCDDACPEYISFSNSINKLTNANKEVKND